MLCCESRWAGYALRIDTKHVPYRIVQVQVITGNTGKPPTWINYRQVFTLDVLVLQVLEQRTSNLHYKAPNRVGITVSTLSSRFNVKIHNNKEEIGQRDNSGHLSLKRTAE